MSSCCSFVRYCCRDNYASNVSGLDHDLSRSRDRSREHSTCTVRFSIRVESLTLTRALA